MIVLIISPYVNKSTQSKAFLSPLHISTGAMHLPLSTILPCYRSAYLPIFLLSSFPFFFSFFLHSFLHLSFHFSACGAKKKARRIGIRRREGYDKVVVGGSRREEEKRRKEFVRLCILIDIRRNRVV